VVGVGLATPVKYASLFFEIEQGPDVRDLRFASTGRRTQKHPDGKGKKMEYGRLKDRR
jgi:hypothetical protein